MLSLFLIIQFPVSYAQTDPILITVSDTMNDVEFDGKWSFPSEWKASSLNSMGDQVMIRSAHQDNFVYIFIDVLSDASLDRGSFIDVLSDVLSDASLDRGSDRAVICFDPDNSKSSIPNDDDYCFVAILDKEVGLTLKGNPSFSSKSNFQKIPNHRDFIAIGAVSDQNDRYLKSPHPSYEFRIPTDLIQRSNHYGFYIEIFDAKSGESQTWPGSIPKKNPMSIPSPNFWGDLISPDKSLPEFPFPILLFVIMLLTMIIMSRKLNSGRLRINIH